MASLRIAHTYDVGSFAAMKALLESEDIYVLDLATGGHVTIAGADQGYYVEVVESDKIRACQILRNHDLGKYILTGAA
jgi:hypothetical protein